MLSGFPSQHCQSNSIAKSAQTGHACSNPTPSKHGNMLPAYPLHHSPAVLEFPFRLENLLRKELLTLNVWQRQHARARHLFRGSTTHHLMQESVATCRRDTNSSSSHAKHGLQAQVPHLAKANHDQPAGADLQF